MRTVRPARALLAILAVPILALALASPVVAQSAASHPASPKHIVAQGTFATYSAGATAITYDSTLVPIGAKAWVTARYGWHQKTIVVLAVQGLVPNREYGSHAHSSACGATGAAAGPHFQFSPDPVSPSIDPAYANSDNEIWLDFTTDRKGRAWAVAVQDWQPAADRRPASVIIHLEHTHDGTDGGSPGTAGARLACLTVGF